jgi:hypothetical protein
MIRVVPRREKAAQRDPMIWRPDFFAQPRLEYQIERVLLIDRCRVRSCAMAARYERRHLDRRLPFENDRIHGFFCAYRRVRI